MRRPGVYEERQTELPDVAQALERRRVDQLEGEWIEPDVVPEGVADDFDRHVAYHSGDWVRSPDQSDPRRNIPFAVVVGTSMRMPTQAPKTPPAPPQAPVIVAPQGSIEALQAQ